MVARSNPVGIAPKPKPEPPQDELERLRSLREKLRRLLAGAQRTNDEIAALEQQLDKRAA